MLRPACAAPVASGVSGRSGRGPPAVAALRARVSDRATDAMRTHLSRVNNDLFGETA